MEQLVEQFRRRTGITPPADVADYEWLQDLIGRWNSGDSEAETLAHAIAYFQEHPDRLAPAVAWATLRARWRDAPRGTYLRERCMADELAAELHFKVRCQPHADLLEPAAHVTVALQHAVELLVCSDVAAFVGRQARLVAHLRRARRSGEPANKPEAIAAAWPSSPRAIIGPSVAASALQSAIEFARQVWFRAQPPLGASHYDQLLLRPVASQAPAPAFAEWFDKFRDNARASGYLPPADQWPAWQMRREHGELLLLLDDERKRAIEQQATPADEPAGIAGENGMMGLTVANAAARLGGESEESVRRWCREGKSPCHRARKIGGTWRIPEADIPE